MKKHSVFCFFTYISVLFFWDSIGVLRCAVLAAILHESGHIIAWLFLIKEKPHISLSPGGFSLQWNPLSCQRWKETLILAAGPLTNFFTAGICLFFLSCHITFMLCIFMAANLCIGLFNCIPFSFLDGGRLLELWLPASLHPFFSAVRAIFGIMLLSAGIFLFFQSDQYASKISAVMLLIYFILKQKPLTNCK